MPKPEDDRPKPGEMVLLRGSSEQPVWAEPNRYRSGIVLPGALGLVISSSHKSPWRFYSYVLWSVPTICGWMPDGVLRRVT